MAQVKDGNLEKLYGQTVWVHRNLQRKCYSVKHKNVLVAHCDFVVLDCVEFRIWKGSQARARSHGQRNVHAFAVGILMPHEIGMCQEPISYHYQRNDTFVSLLTSDPVLKAPRVELRKDGAFI